MRVLNVTATREEDCFGRTYDTQWKVVTDGEDIYPAGVYLIGKNGTFCSSLNFSENDEVEDLEVINTVLAFLINAKVEAEWDELNDCLSFADGTIFQFDN